MASSERAAGRRRAASEADGSADPYRRAGLLAAIEQALAAQGKTRETLRVRDLAAVDEFHVGGRRATAHLVDQLGLGARDRALDVGCGLGGAARLVADRVGCCVAGVDLSADYVATGRVLCSWLGLQRRIALQRADALALPFADGSFDGGWMLHVGMNIADKPALFREVGRVLRGNARFGVYDIMRAAAGEPGFPLPWADDPGHSRLATPAQYREALAAAGFEVLRATDRREFALEMLREQRAAAAVPPPLGLHLLMGETATVKLANLAAAIEDGRLTPVEIVARKTDPPGAARSGPAAADWHIRAARPADAAGLSRCMAAAYAVYAARLDGARLPPLEADYAAEIRDYPAWVVERDGDIVGGLIMTLDAGEASIANVAVDPACQGEGIGGALIRFAEARARERGHTRLDLATHVLLSENLALYRHLGWRESGRDATRVFMRKRLDPAAPRE